MSSQIRLTVFTILAILSLAAGGWLAYQGFRIESLSQAVFDPQRSATIDADVVQRREQDGELRVRIRFTPHEQGRAPVESMWALIPKELFDSLPATDAKLTINYALEAPEWYALPVEQSRYLSDARTFSMLLVLLGSLVSLIGLVWSAWLSFGNCDPITTSGVLGCLGGKHDDYSGYTPQVVMQYKTSPLAFLLNHEDRTYELNCPHCDKPVKLRLWSMSNSRLPGTQLASGILAGTLCLAGGLSLWELCPTWVVVLVACAGVLIAGIIGWRWWRRPGFHESVVIIEGVGKVIHSKTGDNGTQVNWHEHELLNAG